MRAYLMCPGCARVYVTWESLGLRRAHGRAPGTDHTSESPQLRVSFSISECHRS